MARQNVKNIESLAMELKNKLSRTNASYDFKIGVIVSSDNTYSKTNFPFTLAQIVSQKILSLGYESEIISLPAINERLRIFCADNEVVCAYKKQVANFLEMILSEKHFDGVVFLPSGFNCTVGCIISSIRLNIPTVILPVGLSQKVEGSNLFDILSMPGFIATNKKSAFDLEKAKTNFCETNGSGVNFSTENIFNTVLEIMELSETNSALTPANSFKKEDEAGRVAEHIVELTKSRLPLKKIINKKSITNALMLNSALGGSFSVANALLELANEAEIDIDESKMIALSQKSPVLFDTSTGTSNFANQGGTNGIIKAMIKNKIIDGTYKTFSQQSLIEMTKDAENFESFLTPLKKESFVILKGNLADKYAVSKAICVGEDKTKIISNAVVFESDEEASNAVLNNILNKGDVIIIKAKVAKNCPCTVCKTPLSLVSTGREKDHIIVTNGFLEDSINCLGITCVSSLESTLELLENGDEIEIDFVKGKLNVSLSNRDLLKRQKKVLSSRKSLPKYFKSL
ncbi:MAG: hypothetical protein EOM55_01655 [Clostridia bacterium]|nr:hypothetical protein [Clostridia bacterium]